MKCNSFEKRNRHSVRNSANEDAFFRSLHLVSGTKCPRCKSYNIFFTNFANETNIDIISSLRGGPLSVSEISKKVKMEQSAVSHNLMKLSRCGILSVKQEGKKRIYSLNKETVLPIIELVEKHVEKHCKGGCKHGI